MPRVLNDDEASVLVRHRVGMMSRPVRQLCYYSYETDTHYGEQQNGIAVQAPVVKDGRVR